MTLMKELEKLVFDPEIVHKYLITDTAYMFSACNGVKLEVLKDHVRAQVVKVVSDIYGLEVEITQQWDVTGLTIEGKNYYKPAYLAYKVVGLRYGSWSHDHVIQPYDKYLRTRV